MSKLRDRKRDYFFNKGQDSIISKIFFTTSLLLITLSLFIYTTLYFFLPAFYHDFKVANLRKGLEQLGFLVAEMPLYESEEVLINFSQENNVQLIVLTLDEVPIWSFPTFTQRLSMHQNDPFIAGEMLEGITTIARESGYMVMSFAGEDFVIFYSMTLQPVDEVAQVLFMFIPYIAALITCFTLISVFFYSRLITKPLLQINRVAKRMAKLDFEETCIVESKDEIGQLSESLNQMSNNLEGALVGLKSANAKLKNDIQRERELDKKRREFIATISHELKTPITTVKGQLEAMIYNIGPYKDRDKYLRRSFEVMGDMEGLVKEVLTVSKLEDFEPQFESRDLKELVSSCIESLDYFVKQKNIQLFTELVSTPVLVDDNLMKRAIGNVLNNAVKYAPQDATVHVTLNVRNQCPVLKVYNSGIFIDESELEKVFQPFYRIEKSRNRNTGGSGLGLYIVHQILEAHEVEYTIRNVEAGVEFTMIFFKRD